MPVMLGGESRSTARTIHCRTPSMPPGTLVWVEVDGRWMRARVERIEFAVLHLVAIAGRCHPRTACLKAGAPTFPTCPSQPPPVTCPHLPMSLAPGVRLGPYEVIAQIGVGGMGEVWRATDTNLKRAVAIKVLPEAVAADRDRLARFQREAEVLAALNHPNIAHIHGLEKSGGTTALVMELVEGPTLADRIARGPLPVDEALADRQTDCGGARSRTRARDHPSRPEARERESARRRHGEGARLRVGQSGGTCGRVERHEPTRRPSRHRR